MTERKSLESERAELVALADHIEARLAEAAKKNGFVRAAVHYSEAPTVIDALRRLAAPPDTGAGKSDDVGARISNLAADLVVSGWMASNAHDVERRKKEAEQKLLDFACDEVERHIKRDPSVMPDHGGADAGVEEGWTGRKCPHCKGTGENLSAYIVDDFTRCNHCGGTGDEYGPLSKPAPVAANASEFGTVRGSLDKLGRRVAPVVMPESLKDTIATCYGLLWHVETDSKYIHRARRGLLQWITKDEQGRGIENARAIAIANHIPLPDGGGEQ